MQACINAGCTSARVIPKFLVPPSQKHHCSTGGVREDISKTVIALDIKKGAHHLDLMWAEEEDPHSVRDAREIERHHIRRWIKEASASLQQYQNAVMETA